MPPPLRASQLFRTEPPPAPKEPFGRGTELTFELRPHSARAVRSGKRVTIVAGNSVPLGRVLDEVISKAFATGVLQVSGSTVKRELNTGRCVGKFLPSFFTHSCPSDD